MRDRKDQAQNKIMNPISTSSRARERFLEAILQSAIEYAIIALDLDSRVITWNEGARRILGWDETEIVGHPVAVIFTEEDRAAGIPQREMTAALTQGHGDDERWHLRKDGSLFWASGQMMALRSDDGELEGFVKILRDRTEQRENEERQRVLMHELSHRIKNTLAVVQAITNQSFRNAASIEAAEQSISSRIKAYANAHDILLQKNWLSAAVDTIIEATAVNLGVEPSRIKASGPAVSLNPQAALGFALVLHELVTNATKYGALSGDTGTVEIEWSVRKNVGDDRFNLHWQESGGPAVEAPKKKGFGSRLVNTSLSAFGDVSFDYAATGFKLDLEASLQKLQYQNCPDLEV
ncbi:regulator [Rhizobium anhuiense]|uniref:Blue-light-activated histidine kinase n=5 Tax=Rhizobium TaxID=379 RepID=A0A1C3Y9V3_9HYPH|nr:sensor histidine kinase protein [Rhizobium sp. N731]ANL18562.1 sensor histidine kinase protein [Rhizobium sp. N1314]ANL37148.1 sensor histidine kinase protein [Rhizobium phaseoli]PDS34627.1 regulator [Rhizobium anhuiense]PDS81810.1 regulator [Rhizobium sp. L18]PDT26011.1 regulator [Rhizobium sp. L9]PDV85708.1 regulator [Rhizobium sp. H4]RSB87223.1 PAS domain S-box protein [Rhizobium sophoriradicis]RUM03686.1 PAS domain S-box protein [Rhizobium chutanense]SCB61248.1 PAS domain S-box-cont